MRDYSTTTLGYLAQRGSVSMHALVWIVARNWDTGAEETIGLWTGGDHRDFVIGGATRTYYGRSSLMQIEPIRYGKGLAVRTQRLFFGGISEEVELAIRGYDTRHARVEIHRALFEPGTHLLVDTPHRMFAGFIDRIRWPTPAKGGSERVEITLASAARSLTKGLPRYRSDATLKARNPEDAFRKYATVSDQIDTPWGRKK
jgi:hypothetical protein